MIDEQISIFSIEIKEAIDRATEIVLAENDQKKAFELANLIEQKIRESNVDLANPSDLLDYYQLQIIILNFIAFPVLPNEENVNLIASSFIIIFDIDNFDIAEKMKWKLVNLDIDDRDEFKMEIKNALLKNKNIITKLAPIKTVEEWLRDYNVRVGTNIVDSLKRNQYFVDLRKIKELNNIDFFNLKVLFDFYESLKYSSSAPEGFEEEVPIVIGGNKYIFKQGKLDPIESDDLVDVIKEIVDTENGGSVLDELNKPLSVHVQSVDKNADDLPIVATPVAPIVSKPTPVIVPKPVFSLEEDTKPSHPAEVTRDKKNYGEIRPLQTANSSEAKNKELAQLMALATNYPEGSLERRVVEEEIKKVEQR